MACATLKRSIDFDPVHIHGRPSKRQRCIPMSVSPSSSPPASRNDGPSPFQEIHPKMTPEVMAASIREEIKRLYRRRQLHFNPNQEVQGDLSSDSVGGSPPSSPSAFGTVYSPSSRDKPLFTFRQVGMICERMLCEREVQLREEYDRILNMKLNEQYDAFVKFSNDQLYRRFDLAGLPSYLS